VEATEELKKLITCYKKRSKINQYLSNREIIKRYLPHLDVDIGR
jgi:hypothetical protein